MPRRTEACSTVSHLLDAVIVGGGIAGLAAAYELLAARRPFVLLERAPRAGGVILSEEVDGFTIDGGPDSLLSRSRTAIRCARSSVSAIVSCRPSRRGSPTSSAAAGCIRCRRRRCSAFRRASVRSSRTRPVLVARQAAHGARSSFVPRAATARTSRSARS